MSDDNTSLTGSPVGTVLQCRKFSFFDVKTGIDEGKLAESLKDSQITCTTSGRGVIYFGDSNGCVYSLNRQLQVTSFLAHDGPVQIIQALENSNLIVTVEKKTNGPSEVKIWAPNRRDSQGFPICLRVVRPDARPGHGTSKTSSNSAQDLSCPLVTAIAVHPNNALMAIGLSDGSIMLYRGEIRRERGSKSRVIVTFGSGSITNLHFKHSHLFVTTKSNVYCINCTTKDKETTTELDTYGCLPGCTALADSKHEHELLVARNNAIYTYTTDSKASCYVFEGKKVSLSWFRGYLIVVAKEETSSRISNATPTILTVYDPLNKLIALSTVVEGFVQVVGEWGGLYVVTSEPSLQHLSEKDLQSKLELLFRKNQFDTAISLAKMQCCDQEDVAEILKQYGDWLYGKGNTAAAMEQYIKTIPHLEPSYVIKKFLDTQHIENLTTYLQALHKCGNATSDHTTLMLNCYTRLKDSKHLDDFIKEGEVDCDVHLGIKVCRGAGYYDHALALAFKHGLHYHYLSILIDNKKDYTAALRYMSALKFEEAKEAVLQYGSSLLNHIPDETTSFLVQLCTDYKPLDQPLIKEQRSLNSYLTPEEPIFGDPEDFEFLLVGHSETTISFLEQVMVLRPLSQHLNTTLLAELLHQYSLAPEGQDQTVTEEKILKMLRNDEITFDRDHSLLLCDKHQFFAGKLILWEQAGMYDELLNWHAEHGDYKSVVDVCTRHGNDSQQLWSTALRLITSETSTVAPDPDLLNSVLDRIDEFQLLPSLEVVEHITSSPYITLGQVRDYLLRVVASHSASLASEASLTNVHQEETNRLRESINSITTDTIEFTGTKCSVCNNNLDLPSIHFLCRHSFHVHCFESYSENEADCPLCFPENKKLRETIAAQDRNAKRHEILQENLDKTSDCFSVIADFMGRGVFSNYETLSALHPSPNTTKLTAGGSPSIPPSLSRPPTYASTAGNPSEGRVRTTEFKGPTKQEILVPEPENRMRAALERNTPGPVGAGAESRLRLEEHQSHKIDTFSEGRLRQNDGKGSSWQAPTATSNYFKGSIPSNVLNAPSEARLRIMAKQSQSPLSTEIARSKAYGSSHSTLEDLVTPSTYKPIEKPGGNLQSISSQMKVTKSSSFSSSAAASTFNKTSENPFEENRDRLNPFAEDFETEESETNPFAENYGDGEGEDDSDFLNDPNNPFSVNRVDKPSGDDDYDPSLNPFEN